jgi:phosphoribosylformimino-5-aminoimidazole carboxamide ribotide isomerase
MRIVPVLDIMAGQVVRGIAGRRTEYQPIRSTLTSSCSPIDVARAVSERFDLREFYLADLDAITGQRPAAQVYEELADAGYPLWVDAGLSNIESLQSRESPAVRRWVVGLETLTSLADLRGMIDLVSSDRIVFSLDLRNGVPLCPPNIWNEASPLDIARQVLDLGIKRCIILDLARVGMNQGWGGNELLSTLAPDHPGTEFFVAGGIRNAADLEQASRHGAQGALVASALHDGQLSPADLASLDRTKTGMS